MKDKIIAIACLVIVLVAVTVNEVAIKSNIDRTLDALYTFDERATTKDDAEQVFEAFQRREHYISLTVSHEDLTSIEESFCDMIGYIKVGDTDNAAVAKSRLIHSLEHLRRLSVLNIDSII